MRTPAILILSISLLSLAACSQSVPPPPQAPSAPTPITQTPPQPIPTSGDPRILVVAPFPNAIVQSPLTVYGKARGSWYFEGSFPIVLKDENGGTLATGIAQAQGEWMTEDFVPFSASLEYATSASRGMLLLKKDNPSGQSELDASVSVPVKFRP